MWHRPLQHTIVTAAIRQAFNPSDRAHAGEPWCKIAEQLRPRWPKLADLMDASEHDVRAYMSFPRQHRTRLHSTNPIKRLNKEVKRRADVVGIFLNERSITRAGMASSVVMQFSGELELHDGMRSPESAGAFLQSRQKVRRVPASATEPARVPAGRTARRGVLRESSPRGRAGWGDEWDRDRTS